MAVTFQFPTKLILGWDGLGELPRETAGFGNKALLVVGRSVRKTGILEKIINKGDKNISWEVFEAGGGEPTLEIIDRGVKDGRLYQPDVIVGIGGGSVMDTAKALAGLIPNQGEIKEYFYGRKMETPPLPVITVPTLFGSGAEVSFNAVLTDQETGVKQSLRDQRLRPQTAIIDPGLSRTAPRESLIHSGLDGLTQSLEAFVSKNASCLSDLFAQDGVKRFSRAMAGLAEGTLTDDLFEDLAYGSVYGGIALAAARLGAVHGLAHPVGALYNQPHGKVCAAILPAVMKFNLPVVTGKYELLAKALELPTDGDEVDRAAALIKHVRAFNRKFGIPARWRDLGVKKEDFPLLVERSLPSGSLKANPRPVTAGDLFRMLEENW